MQLFDITNLWHSIVLSRQTKLRIAGCVACFFFFYALFYAVLYGQTKSEAYLVSITQKAHAYGIVISSPTVQFFPPAIFIPTVQITAKNNAQLTLENLDISIGILTSSATFEAQLLNGTIKGSIDASSFFSPEHITADIQCDAIALPKLVAFAGLRKSGALIQILQGSLDSTLTIDMPISARGPNLGASTGTLKLGMQNGAITHGLPLLVAPRLDDLMAEASITWDNRKVHIEQVKVTNPVLHISLEGGITANMVKPLDSTLDIRALVRIPLDQLHTEFVPPRTLRALKEQQQVRISITKTLRKPAIDVRL